MGTNGGDADSRGRPPGARSKGADGQPEPAEPAADEHAPAATGGEPDLAAGAVAGVAQGGFEQRLRAAEDLLAASERRFSTAVETMLDGFGIESAVRDEAGRIVDFRIDYVNEAACRILGRPRDALVGARLLDMFPTAGRSDMFAMFVATVEEGVPLVRDAMPFGQARFDGETRAPRTFEVRGTRLGDGLAVSFRDVSERHRAEEERFDAHQMLQLVLDTIPEAVFWKDRESRILGANAAFARDAGRDDPASLVGLTDFDLVRSDVAARYRDDDEGVMASGEPRLNYEQVSERPDGTAVWLRVSKLPLRDAAGRVVGMLGTYADITERKRTEQAVRQSEAFLNVVVDNIPDMIVVKDARDLRFIRVNQAFERMTGHKRDELIGRTDYEISPLEEADWYRANDLKTIGTGQLVDVPEEPYSASQFGERTLHTKKLPIYDERGEAIYLLAISEDITDRKRAEEALQKSEERYRNITEAITDYVYTVHVLEGEAVATIHGAGCVAVTGYTSDELAADPDLWLTMVVAPDRDAVLEQTRRILSGGPCAPLEHRIVRKDGATRWVRNTPVPQYDPAGALVAYDGLIQDITERRALQEQLLQAQKMEGIGRLAGGVAHDFNNLLTAILGYVELAKADLPPDLPTDDPARLDLDEVAAAGERAASLTRQLLAFASKQIVAPVKLDLGALVADSLNMLRRLLGEHIEIMTVLEPAMGSVEADPGQIQQLLVNLTVNARDAMPDGGRLTIETAPELVTADYAAQHPGVSEGLHARLSVTDTGSGMSEEVRSHLFEPFFTTKGRGKGTGLGLATCHGIVKQMGGHIQLYSEVGQGTTFRIYLPMIAGPAAALQGQPAAVAPAPVGTETVLVVEDEPSVRRLAVLGLRAQGYSVLEAADGAAALAIASRIGSTIDLVVSDVVMPGMSGPELVRRLAAAGCPSRVLLMSGHAEADVLPSGRNHVGTPFLPKPFTPERLARRVREVLDAG